VSVPICPDYHLSRNYGDDYMTVLKTHKDFRLGKKLSKMENYIKFTTEPKPVLVQPSIKK
jgi:hypothetical protein